MNELVCDSVWHIAYFIYLYIIHINISAIKPIELPEYILLVICVIFSVYQPVSGKW